VAGYCAEEFGIPTIIGRMNVAYGRGGGIPYQHMELILAGKPVTIREDPLRYSPIHESDIVGHMDGLLAAAVAAAPIVNFGGDEVVTAQQWCRLLGQLGGIEPRIRIERLPGMQPGMSVDPTERRRLTGPDRMGWRDGISDMYNGYVGRYRR
jgi:nucleoside-diphosphate-sugar epimerase